MADLRLRVRSNPDLLLAALGAPILWLLTLDLNAAPLRGAALANTQASLADTGGPLWLLRLLLGVPYFLLVAGYPLTWLLYPQPGRLSIVERLLLSLGLSLLGTYPLGLLNVAREGQVMVFRPHLSGLLEAYMAAVAVLCLLAARARRREGFRWTMPPLRPSRLAGLLALLFAVSLALNLYDIGRHDFEIDDWVLAKRAYDLIDGTFAARRAYSLSFNDHPPLMNFAAHPILQLLDSRGVHHIGPEVYRAPSTLLEALTTLAVALLGARLFGARAGLAAGLLLAFNNFHVWRGRMFGTEVLLALFFLLCMAFFHRALQPGGTRRDSTVAGLMLGGALLTKTPGILFIPALALLELLRVLPALHRPREWPGLAARALRGPLRALRFLLGLRSTRAVAVGLLCFLPVVAYNAGAYLTTGYMDITFSKIFNLPQSPIGPNPRGYGGAPFSPENLGRIALFLVDAYSLPVLLLLGAASAWALRGLRSEKEPGALLLPGLWLLMGLLFFYATGVNYWHLSILTPPLALLAGASISRLPGWRRGPAIAVGLLVVGVSLYGAVYMVRTNYDRGYVALFPPDGAYPTLSQVAVEPYARILRQKHEDQGLSALREALRGRHTPGDLLVVRDDLRETNLGWPVVSALVEKLYPDPWVRPEVRGPKDVDYQPKVLRTEGRVALGEGGLGRIVALSNLSEADRPPGGTTRVLLQNTGVYGFVEPAGPGVAGEVARRAALLRERYPQSWVARGPDGTEFYALLELGPGDRLPF
ncbi:MAG: glycosyltransferase family 39 protein [Euryarchaeota archaeon]|nr:glycosyltransferase family 39 protein [Euryarchaeota archaeon]